MCIRDRELPKEIEIHIRSLIYIDNVQDILNIPVSYTHLDVYKRQRGAGDGGGHLARNGTHRRFQAARPPRGGTVRRRGDVYKRQLVDKGLAAYKEAGVEAHGYVLSLIHI